MPALFPSSVYSGRPVVNVPGVSYDPSILTRIFAEDVSGLNAEVNAVETFLLGLPDFSGYTLYASDTSAALDWDLREFYGDWQFSAGLRDHTGELGSFYAPLVSDGANCVWGTGAGLILNAQLVRVNASGNTANISGTTLYAGVEEYIVRILATVTLTQAASVSSTLPSVFITYTSADTNASVTIQATPNIAGNGQGQTGAMTANTVGTTASGCIAIFPKSSSTISYSTSGYVSTAAGMKYSVHIVATY